VRAEREQAKLAVRLLMQDGLSPGTPCSTGRPGIDADELDLEMALGEFSRDISRGAPADRLRAVEALVWFGDRRVVSPLLRALGDPEWDVRHAAAGGLVRLSPVPEWAFAAAAAATRDPEPCVRVAAATVVGRSEHYAAPGPLASLLRDPCRWVRLEAIWGLKELGRLQITDSTAAISLLRVLWQDEDLFVAYDAYWALATQGGTRLLPERAAFRRSARGRRVWWAARATLGVVREE
jgi:HEAT repeat protein